MGICFRFIGKWVLNLACFSIENLLAKIDLLLVTPVPFTNLSISLLLVKCKEDVVNCMRQQFPWAHSRSKRMKLGKMSYHELSNIVKVDRYFKLFQTAFHGSLVVGPDAIPAIYFRDNGYQDLQDWFWMICREICW